MAEQQPPTKEPKLVPVEGDPFKQNGHKLIPVEGDPFASAPDAPATLAEDGASPSGVPGQPPKAEPPTTALSTESKRVAEMRGRLGRQQVTPEKPLEEWEQKAIAQGQAAVEDYRQHLISSQVRKLPVFASTAQELSGIDAGHLKVVDEQTIDPREQKIQEDFLASGDGQYTPAFIEQKKAAGRWTGSDEFRFQEGGLRKQAEILDARQRQLSKDMLAAGKEGWDVEGQELQKMQEGLLAMKQSLDERQKAGQQIAPQDVAAYNEGIGVFNERSAALEKIITPYRIQADDIQEGKLFVQDRYDKLLKDPPEDLQQWWNDRIQKEAAESFKQAQRDISHGNYLTGDVLSNFVAKPIFNTAHKMMLDATGAALRIADAAGNLPTTATGGEQYYSPMAQAADWITEGVDRLDATEAQAGKENLIGEDWKFNPTSALPQFLRMGTYMAGLMASGGAGGARGLVAAGVATTEEDYYREAIAKGLTPVQAQEFSLKASTSTAFLELINPQLYAAGTVKGMMAKRALKAIKDGATNKEAVRDGTLFVMKEMGGEITQETMQSLSDVFARYASNTALGEDKLDVNYTLREFTETALMTAVLSGLAAGGARALDKPLHQQSIEWAVKHRNEVEQYVQDNAPEEAKQLMANLDKYAKIYNGLPDALSKPDKIEQRAEIVAAITEKERIKEEEANATVDETMEMISGNKFEVAKLKEDERIAKAMGVPLPTDETEAKTTTPPPAPAAPPEGEGTTVPVGGEGERTGADAVPQPQVEENLAGAAPDRGGGEVLAAVPEVQGDAGRVGGADAEGGAEAQAADPERERLSQEVEQAKRELSRAQADINDRGQALFPPEEGQAQQTIDAGFENTPENYERILSPIRDRVAQAEKAVAEYDAKAGERSKAAEKQTRTDQAPMAQKPSDATPVATGKPRLDRVLNALKGIAPGLTITIHETTADYATGIAHIGDKYASTQGLYYDVGVNEIHVNKAEAKDLKQTLFHESAHPIILALYRNKPDLFVDFVHEVRNHPDGKRYEKFAGQYAGQSMDRQMMEMLAEFMGDVASGKVKVSTKPDSLYQRFKAWLRDVMAALGWDVRSIDLSEPQNVRDFAAQFKRAMDKGIRIKGFEPVGGKDGKAMLQDDADRLVNGWYSRLDQSVAAKGITQPASEWLNWMQSRAKEGAFSMEEVKWTGLADFLDGKKKVTPQEVRAFLKDNRVKVEVKVLSDGGVGKSEVRKEDVTRVEDGAQWHVHFNTGELVSVNRDSAETEQAAIEYAVDKLNDAADDTKFSQYQLPGGGTNYQEVLVTLPRRVKPEFAGKDISKEPHPYMGSFMSSHFDEPNILVHLRVNDRTDADGKKVLFIEEVQSDWGQKGKKEGFAKTTPPVPVSAVQFDNGIKAPLPHYEVTLDNGKKHYVFAETEADALKVAAEDLRSIYSQPSRLQGVPSAPFVTSTDAWVELGMKQAIRMAVEGGYDKIAWTTGEQQNERYDLSKQVDYIENAGWDGSGNTQIDISTPSQFTSLFVDEKGIVQRVKGNVLSEAEGKPLSDVIGKDVAERVLAAKDGERLEGDGLKLGGTGMKGFYDKILPAVAKKLSKKLGGDGAVGDVTFPMPGRKVKDERSRTALDATTLAYIEGGGSMQQPSIAITDAMRASVRSGVPLMQMGVTDPDAIRVQKMFDKQAATMAKATKRNSGGVRAWYVKNFEDTAGMVKEALRSIDGHKAVQERIRQGGASAAAKLKWKDFHKRIYKGLSKEEEALLGRVIESKRTITVDAKRDAENKPRVKNPDGLHKEQHEKWLSDMRASSPETMKGLEKRANAYFDAQRELLKMKLDEGRISPELYDNLVSWDYARRAYLHHIEDAEGAGGTSIYGSNAARSDIKALDEGSEEVLYNDFRYLLKAHTLSTYKTNFENRANKELGKLAADPDNGLLELVDPAGLNKTTGQPVYPDPKAGNGHIMYFEDGIKRVVEAPMDFVQQWNQAEPLIKQELANAIRIGTLGAFKRMMLTGINPAFILTNTPRDMLHVLMNTNTYSPILPIGLAQLSKDIASVMKDAVTRGPLYRQYIENGGGMDFLTTQGRPLDAAGKLDEGAYGKTMQVLGYLNETSELLVRLSLFKREMDRGRTPAEAVVIARDQMDFNQGGTTAKALDNFLPYLNAAFQGTRVYLRYARNNPKLWAFKTAQLGAIAAATVLYNLLQYPDDWDEISEDIKARYFIIMLPLTAVDKDGRVRRKYLSIAKSQDQAVMAGLFEGMAEYAQTGKYPSSRIMNDVEIGLPDLNPMKIPAMDALYSYYTGFDTYRDRKVYEKQGDVEPWREYTTGKTPAFFINLGKLTASRDEDGRLIGGISPERARLAADKIAGAPTGNIYYSLINKSYGAVTEALGVNPREELDKSVTEHINEIVKPFRSRVLKETNPAGKLDELRTASRRAETSRVDQNDHVRGLLARRRGAEQEERKGIDKEMAQWVKGQPDFDQERILKRYVEGIKNKDVDFWYIILKTTSSPEARAMAVFNEWRTMDDQERTEMFSTIDSVGGISGERFAKEFVRLKTAYGGAEK